MAPVCLYEHPTTSEHAPDEEGDGALGDLLSDMDQGISPWIGFCWFLVASDALIHNVP